MVKYVLVKNCVIISERHLQILLRESKIQLISNAKDSFAWNCVEVRCPSVHIGAQVEKHFIVERNGDFYSLFAQHII